MSCGLTECDQHLVRLLLRPLQRLRWLLIPGGIAAGYLVNTTIVSQTGTAAVLGPILIPLLRAGGVAPATAGAILLLGSSMGGELFNPGAVEMRKLAELTGLSGPAVVARLEPAEPAGLRRRPCCRSGSLAAIGRGQRSRSPPEPARRSSRPADRSIRRSTRSRRSCRSSRLSCSSPTRAWEPTRPCGRSRARPRSWPRCSIGIVLAGSTSPRLCGQLATAFFEGAGYAYTHVISLIVAASTFAEGIRHSGLIEMMVQVLVGWPKAALVVGTLAPWALAVVSGTGIAPAVSIMEFFVPVAASMGLDPVRLGTVAALGSHFGRTMSPAAAVVAMSARLAGVPASELIRRVTIPLLIGGLVLIAAAMAWSY